MSNLDLQPRSRKAWLIAIGVGLVLVATHVFGLLPLLRRVLPIGQETIWFGVIDSLVLIFAAGLALHAGARFGRRRSSNGN